MLLSLQQYRYPSHDEINSRLNYLDRVVSTPLESEAEITELNQYSHEWIFFTYAFTTYAMANLITMDSTSITRSCSVMKQCIEQVLTPTIQNPFGIRHELLASDTIPSYSVLYLGHLNLMLGSYRKFSSDTTYNRLNDMISNSLRKRYLKSSSMLLPSYPGAIWMPDNVVAMASLFLHHKNTSSSYNALCNTWVKYIQDHYLHQETGLLYSTVDYDSDEPLEEPRGSMLGWSIMFLNYFSPQFAKEQYFRYKKEFSNNLLVLRIFKEWQNYSETHAGDLDSGPVFRGYSIPANGFALSCAIASNDLRTAKKLERLVQIGTREIEKDNELRYEVRFVDLSISPLAEALTLYALTTPH